jgi:Zinc finger, C3HC4 type (RING finger)
MSTRGCAFCLTTGHQIHQCCSPAIEELHKQTMEFAAVSNMIMNHYIYISQLIRAYSIPQLRVLGYRFNLVLSAKPGYKKFRDFCLELANHYFLFVHQDRYTIISQTSDNRLRAIITQLTDLIHILYPNQDSQYLQSFMLRRMEELMPNKQRYAIIPYYDMSLGPNLSENLGQNISCAICLSSTTTNIEYNCGHSFCGHCNMEYFSKLTRQKTPICSLCRTRIISVKSVNKEVVGEFMERYCRTNDLLIIEPLTRVWDDKNEEEVEEDDKDDKNDSYILLPEKKPTFLQRFYEWTLQIYQIIEYLRLPNNIQ